MSRKTKITINLVAIIIIVLSLFGVTFGYYYTKIKDNQNKTSVEIVTGNVSVLYTDLSENDIELIIEPGVTVTKLFTVKNTGNALATYSIYLVDVINEFARTKDLTYTLYKKQGDNSIDINDFSDCEVLVENEEYPKTVSVIKAAEVIETPDDIYTYALVITYKNSLTENQNIDQNKTFSGKVNIRATSKEEINPFSEGTLAYSILNNGAKVFDITKNELSVNKTYPEKTEITKVSDGTDMSDTGIFTAPDDYGISYYFRGPVKNNYVNFAGFTWRIVRINGDGSIRLILNGTLDKVCHKDKQNLDGTCPSGVNEGTVSQYNSSYNNNAYIGYMYGLALTDTENVNQERCLKLNENSVTDYIEEYSTQGTCENAGGKWTTNSYEATHANLKDSTIKAAVDSFYEKNIIDYESYLADTLFCNDKTLVTQWNSLGFGTNFSYYMPYYRLYTNITSISFTNPAIPSLKCAEGETNNYSRLTSTIETDKTLSNGLSINNDLKHPIALLTADELVLAGAFRDVKNESYYLSDTYNNTWWTNSPYSGKTNDDEVFYSRISSSSLNMLYVTDITLGVRPVINLRANVLVDSGNGTEGAGAYTVKLPG